MLIIISGLPASGKSFFARALCKKMEAYHINTDILREEMNLRGKYAPNQKQVVYTEMRARVGNYLKEGKTVVVDGTFIKAESRRSFYELAEQVDVPFYVIAIKAQEDTIAIRMKTKRRYSEADFDVYLKLKEQSQVIKRKHLVLWSDKLSLEQMLERTENYLPIHQDIKIDSL